MVVQWAAEPALRAELRELIQKQASSFKPDVILGHSLGSLACYDLLVQPNLPASLKTT